MTENCKKSILIIGDPLILLITIVSFITRLWSLQIPASIVFDELHYGRQVSYYINRTFSLDSTPPLGKLLVTAAGWLSGFDGSCSFERIGQDYPPSVPIWHMRLVPAVMGSLIVPVAYQIMSEMNFSHWTSALAATMILFENATITQSRFVFIDAPLIFFSTLAVLFYLKFRKVNKLFPWSMAWWFYLCGIGTTIGLSISTRYSALFTVFFILFHVCRDFWDMLPCRSLSRVQLWKHAVVRFLFIVIVPTLIYTLVFYIHLSVLIKSGPHDSLMTSAFQASLKGGLADVTEGQPTVVAHGSQVTLRHTYGKPCWLHSHKHLYPLQYSDGRGSSHQQQVTCCSFKDVDNWWIIKNPIRNSLIVEDSIRPVKDGDVIQLIHGMTRRPLNSHDVAAPMSPQFQEVSCFVDHNISNVAEQNLWRVKILNADKVGSVWRTIVSEIQLEHVNSLQVLKTSGQSLPDWGLNQLEVVTDRSHNQPTATWNVEEHRYTASDRGERKVKESAGREQRRLGFLSMFVELQWKMWTSQLGAATEHTYSSEPSEWPFMERNIVYWVDSITNAQIHLLGNPVVWYSSSCSVLIYSVLLIFYLLRRRRACYDLTEEAWLQFVDTGLILLTGYLTHYIPYLVTDQTLFLYHYLPSLMFTIMLFAATVDHVYNILVQRFPALRYVWISVVIVWLSVVVNVFITFAPVTYGQEALTSESANKLRWKDTWDFIVRSRL